MANKKITRNSNKTLLLYDLGGQISSISSGLTSIVGAGAQNAQLKDTSSIQNLINNNMNYKSNAIDNDSLMQDWANMQLGNNISYKDVRGGSTGSRLLNTLSAAGSGAISGASFGAAGAVIGGLAGLGSGIFGWARGDALAKQKQNSLNKQTQEANQHIVNTMIQKGLNIDKTNDLSLMANYSAFGGNLYTNVPNADTHGGEFSNGVTIINNGGTHEENPLSGVPMGIAENGEENLVEEGEVRYNDYMFSNRLFANEKLLDAVKLPTSFNNHSFADIAERINRESSERPNDPISKKGLQANMAKLQMAQEQLKQKDTMKKTGNVFAPGGPLTFDKLQASNIYQPFNDTKAPVTFPTKVGVKVDPNYLNSLNPNKDTKASAFNMDSSILRYAPAIGSGIMTLTDALGLTNKADYSNAEAIGNSANNLSTISFNPIGDKLKYNPFDRDYYINKLNANAGATRSAIRENSGGNRINAQQNLLASDYNYGQSLGNLARQAEEQNQTQLQRVAEFNRATNQFNTEGAFRAASVNKQNDELRMRAKQIEAQMRESIDAQSAQAKMANLNSFLESLGGIGQEEDSKKTIKMLLDKGVLTSPKACGGKLKTKRKGLTY